MHLAQALQDGGAQGGIHHRDGLVRDDQARLQQQRARNHDALPLATTELMRVAAQGFVRAQANCVQRLLHQGTGLLLGRCQLELLDRRAQDMVHLVEGVVDLVRILKDHLHVPQELLALRAVELRDVLAAVEDLATGGRGQAQQQPRQGRLARS